jgi:hypothetical protein
MIGFANGLLLYPTGRFFPFLFFFFLLLLFKARRECGYFLCGISSPLEAGGCE